MDDIVERLREGATVLDEPFHRNALELVMLEAADEIERLRTELADAMKAIDRLHDERRRLQDQIGEISRDLLKHGAAYEKAVCKLTAECEALRKDAERLDFVERSSKGYGLGWIFRESRTGRGMRLHETSEEGASASAREAIDRAMASGAEGGGDDR